MREEGPALEEQKDFSAIGQEILFAARNELYTNCI